MYRALALSLALALCAPGHAAVADTSPPSASLAATKKKPAPKPKMAGKRTNFTSGVLNCNPVTIDWGDYIRCGYDYPPWALGWDSFKRAQAKSKSK